jgi:hypothetical protein
MRECPASRLSQLYPSPTRLRSTLVNICIYTEASGFFQENIFRIHRKALREKRLGHIIISAVCGGILEDSLNGRFVETCQGTALLDGLTRKHGYMEDRESAKRRKRETSRIRASANIRRPPAACSLRPLAETESRRNSTGKTSCTRMFTIWTVPPCREGFIEYRPV